MGEIDRKRYPQDVTDEEWLFVLPYLMLTREDIQSRRHSLRELFSGVLYTGSEVQWNGNTGLMGVNRLFSGLAEWSEGTLGD